MAYQDVTSCRVYIDFGLKLKSQGNFRSTERFETGEEGLINDSLENYNYDINKELTSLDPIKTRKIIIALNIKSFLNTIC